MVTNVKVKDIVKSDPDITQYINTDLVILFKN